MNTYLNHIRYSLIALLIIVSSTVVYSQSTTVQFNVNMKQQISLGNFYWPAFNVADSAICVGVALLFLDGFKKPQNVDSTS